MAKVLLLCVLFGVSFVNCQFGFFQQPREERRNGFGFGFDPRRIVERFNGFFNPRQEYQNNYPGIVFPGNVGPTSNQEDPNYNPNYNPNYGQYGQNTQYNPYGQNYDYNQNGQVEFSTSNPSQVNFVNNFNEPDPPSEPNNNGNFNVPTNGDGFSNVPPNGGGFSNNPPNGGFSNVPPSGGGFSNVPPNGGGFSNVPPAGDGNSGIPNEPPVNFNDERAALPVLTPVPTFEQRNNFNFGSAGLFQETCTTVDQEVGSCISLLQCSRYLKIVQESRTNPNAVTLLRRAHCGFEGNTPKVCCPRPGIPTGVPTALPTTTTTTTEATTTTTTTVAPQPSPKLEPVDFVPALPDPPVCGVSNASFSRVVGGVNAKLGDFPWMALLGYKNRRGPGARWLCGGSLITSKHVLTAAHCIHGHEDDLFIVRLGELDLEKEDEGATPVDVPIKTKVKHEQYSGTAFTSDIGILVLQNEVTFTDLIKPICIPKDSELRARSFEDYNPIIAGWGDTEFRGPSATRLQALQLPVVSNDYCKTAYVSYKKQTIDERVLCAGYKKGGKDACQGDSGGPLMQPIWNQQDYKTHFYQIGVVSFGKKCAEAGFPGVYSRVTHFVPWIESKVIGTA